MNRPTKAVLLLLGLASLQACGGSGQPAATPAPSGTGLTRMEPQGNATGAVTTITPEGEGRHGTLAEEILQGRVPGLDIVNSGGVRTVRVRNAGRGDSQDISIEPLLIIDGVPRPVGSGQVLDALTGINFEDVAKIQVLRDASSTAIYGTQGANGVIKITLKHD